MGITHTNLISTFLHFVHNAFFVENEVSFRNILQIKFYSQTLCHKELSKVAVDILKQWFPTIFYLSPHVT
jgi:hypothetical protein